LGHHVNHTSQPFDCKTLVFLVLGEVTAILVATSVDKIKDHPEPVWHERHEPFDRLQVVGGIGPKDGEPHKLRPDPIGFCSSLLYLVGLEQPGTALHRTQDDSRFAENVGGLTAYRLGPVHRAFFPAGSTVEVSAQRNAAKRTDHSKNG
jgi:hypothetical protein